MCSLFFLSCLRLIFSSELLVLYPVLLFFHLECSGRLVQKNHAAQLISMDFQSGSLHTEFLCCLELLDLQEFEKITPPKFNSSPLKSYRNPIGKACLPTIHFSGVNSLLNVRGVSMIKPSNATSFWKNPWLPKTN